MESSPTIDLADWDGDEEQKTGKGNAVLGTKITYMLSERKASNVFIGAVQHIYITVFEATSRTKIEEFNELFGLVERRLQMKMDV